MVGGWYRSVATKVTICQGVNSGPGGELPGPGGESPGPGGEIPEFGNCEGVNSMPRREISGPGGDIPGPGGEILEFGSWCSLLKPTKFKKDDGRG